MPRSWRALLLRTLMGGSSELEQIVQRVVGEVVDSHLGELRQELVRRVLEEVQRALPAAPAAATTARLPAPGEVPATAILDAAVASVQDAASQADILRALLDGAAKFCGRVVLFVVRAGAASGWQARGFEDNNALRNYSLDINKGLAARAVRDCAPVAAAAVEFDPGFIQSVGNPVDGNALALPLVVKEKVAALIYADAGTAKDGLMDTSALQLLVRSAGLWLETLSLRKAGVTAAVEPAMPPAEEAAAPPPVVSAAPVAAVRAPEPAPPPAPKPAAAPAAVAMSPQEEEVHRKARRFAKLLVDEIKLYNPAKVDQGRQKKDLYDRLKEDIEKSRATYDKRYSNTPAASANYFRQEIIRILADNDSSLLGSNFPD